MTSYITKEQANEAIKNVCEEWHLGYGNERFGGSGNALFHAFDDIPTTEVKPIEYGEWEHIVKGFMEFGEIRCSKCGWKNDFIKKFNFCPNCGSDMRKESEEEK